MSESAVSIPRPSEPGWSRLFWTTFEHSSNPMLLLRLNREIIAINPAFSACFGYAAETLVGRPSDVFVQRRYLNDMRRSWAALRRTGRATGDRGWRRFDGHDVHIDYAAQAQSIDGERLVLFVVLNATADAARSEARGAAGVERLTPREIEVVARLALGRRAHEIAQDLFVSPTTVRTHLRNAMAKVGARSQAQLVSITLTSGILDSAAVIRELERDGDAAADG